MSGFIESAHRHQATLFPDQLEDYISDDNPVRIVDVYVDELDLSGLGFKTIAADTGRPGYHPSIMLKLYIYGYLNRVQSSRRLERECNRNIELIWLLGKLAPDFKTIADFRKDNGEAIQKTCREFVILCRKLDLFSNALIAIDGSKFKAVNHRDKNFTSAKLKHRLKLIDESIAKYLTQIDSADRQDTETGRLTASRLKEKIDRLREEVKALKNIEGGLDKQPDKQISYTDPDARSMRSRGNGLVGYNVQASVDANHHIILDHKVTNIGNDRDQLADMAKRAKAITQLDTLKIIADRGYYKGEEILECEQADITAYIPKPQTSGNRAKGFFSKSDFIYDQAADSFKCPGGYCQRNRSLIDDRLCPTLLL